MIGLARDLARLGEPVLNLLFHSSEAIVGGSPYNRTQGELDAFFDRLESVSRLRHAGAWAPCPRPSPNSAAAYAGPDAHPSRHAAPPAGSGRQRAAALAARNWARGARRRRGVRRASAARGWPGGARRSRHMGAPAQRRTARSRAAPRIRHLRAARIRRASGAAHRQRRHRPRRTATGCWRSWRCCSRGARASRSCSRCTARRSGTTSAKRGRPDLFTRAYHRRVLRHVLQRPADDRARTSSGSAGGNARVVYPAGRRRVYVARRGSAGRRACRARHRQPAPAAERQAPAPARQPADAARSHDRRRPRAIRTRGW